MDTQKMTPDELAVAFNPRNNVRDFNTAVNAVKIETRLQSLIAEGLLTPPLYNSKSGKGLRGYIRVAAIIRLAEEQPSEFARLFPEGTVPVSVVDVNENEARELMNDHGQVEGLERAEVYFSAKELFKAGYGISEASVKLGGQLNVFGGNAAALAAAIEGKSPEEAAKIIKGRRKGSTERLYYVFKLPRCVEKVWVANNQGKKADFKLTQGNLTELHKAFSEDCKADRTITRNKPGKRFLDKWADIEAKGIEKREQGHKTHDPRKWTQKTVENHIGDYTSEAIRTLMLKCSGDTEVELQAVAEADALLEMIEVVKAKDPEFFAVMYEELVRKYEEA